MANADKLDKKVQETVKKRIQLLSHNALTSCFPGCLMREKMYDEADYKRLKRRLPVFNSTGIVSIRLFIALITKLLTLSIKYHFSLKVRYI